ncbi:MAG: aminotransferase class I/II-fold pyridoxal phosphate-dependent enzyme [Fimbriimonadaceae bacterium]|nr:aminotransferase class I/II-fold pyridoxal phosphate-dependent enzyme [Fimbriimonadaceae bacterium]QYK59335.1 MAG: aminotransferase class I/II-fold pyridoxal phosphate-dependent enzyme [Fimbriimonadaceae bacterium]
MARDEAYRDRSVLIHGKFRSEKWDFQDHILPPITTAVAFRLRSATRGAEGFKQFANPDVDRDTAKPIYIYDRLDEPCVGLLEETLAFAEKGECAVCFGTGMGAIAAAIGIHVRSGDHMVYHPAIYGCTYSHIVNWLSRFGVASTPVRFNCLDDVVEAVRPETRVLYFESPSNPTMELVDLEAVAGLVRQLNADRPEDRRIYTVIDNTFASPYAQRPLTHGIDFVVHSLTKHVSGFGATMGGAIVGPRRFETDLLLYRKDFGGSMTPDAAWHILTYGIPTLAMRIEHQQKTALRVAEFLDLHPKVSRVHYPGLDSFPQKALALRQMRDIDGDFSPGAMIFFEVVGKADECYRAAVQVCDHLAANALSVTLAVSLGQIRTLVEHPASMTHSAIPPDEQLKAGISPGGIRLSIGLEDERDILRDLESALESI